MANVTQAEFAKLLGVSHPYIAKLATKGIITLDDAGQLDPDTALQEMRAAGESVAAADTMTFSEFARHINVKPSYITQLKTAGRLVLTDDGKRVVCQQSVQRIEDTKDPSKLGVTARHAEARSADPRPESNDPEADPDNPSESSPEYQVWRARRERAAALREELKLGEEAKHYLKRSDVETVIAAAFTAARTTLETLPDRLAQTLAAEKDDQRIRAILSEEHEHILSNLATSLADMGK